MAQYAHLSNVEDAELAAAIAASPSPPSEFDITATRKSFADMLPLLQQASAYRVEDYNVPVGGGEIRIRVLIPTPQGSEGKTFPLFFWIHGGGWSLGSIEMDDYSMRPIAVKLQMVITSVDYRLAPEYPFPIGVNDCFAALKWTVENAPKFSANLSKGFMVGGASAGGNLATLLSLLARDDPFFQHEGRRLMGQHLSIPAVIHPDAIPEKYKSELLSMEQNKDAPLLPRSTAIGFFNSAQLIILLPRKTLFKRNQILPSSPLFSHHHIKGLPPAYLQIAGLDPLRDEGLLYEKVLSEAGAKTKFDVFAGFPHGGHYAFPTLSVTKKYNNDLTDGLRWLLGVGVSSV